MRGGSRGTAGEDGDIGKRAGGSYSAPRPRPGRETGGVSHFAALLATARPFSNSWPDPEDRNVRNTLLGFLERGEGVPVPQLALMLADPRWYVARNGLHLAAVSHEASLIPAVERLATHPDARVRREAVRALDALAGAAALPTFTRALADPDSAVRIAAAHSAEHFGGPEQEAAVRRQVESHDFRRRPGEETEAMLVALAHLGGERAVPMLRKLWRRRLFHPTPLAGRSAAVTALGAIPTASARKILTDASRSREPAVRRAAEKALSERGS